jgi:hypothetical protein
LAEDLAKHHKYLIAKERGYKNGLKTQLQTAELGTGFACPNKKREELKLEFYALTDEAKKHFVSKKYKVELDSDKNNGRAVLDEDDTPDTDIEVLDEFDGVQTPDRIVRTGAIATPFMKNAPRMSL